MDKAKTIIKFLLAEEEDEDFPFSDIETPRPEPLPDPFDVWEKKYRPIKNHLNPHAGFDGRMFETYGPELEFVRGADPKHVWTYLSGDDNEEIIGAGYHWVNRNGYFITKLPWKDESETYEFGEGDPTDAASLADTFLEKGDTPPDWKPFWLGLAEEEKLEMVRDFADEYYGMGEDAPEAVKIIDQYAQRP